ncbi:nuclear factor 7, brain-like [Mugil cephalus]|uniref:nuclear factor 7, brain-like n=1 Tax=Mugil cephalus TaxID=48193 RepID=UPI001FB687A6|nr:nuclear factor 7, brain-like [Mugil cephalus]
MASQCEEDLCCPACHDIFKDPVLLWCSHSFCRVCLQSWWRRKLVQECPVCRAVSPWSEPPRNLALKNLCEAFLQDRGQRASSGPELLCRLHAEKLKLFCLNHQQPVCIVCRDSEKHAEHRFRPIDEMARDQREQLQTSVRPLQDKLQLLQEVRVVFNHTAQHIKVQARHTERQIKEQFKKLHQFLAEEEEARMAALREEEEQKSQMMKEKMEALSREIAALSDTVRATEEELRAEDVSFLNNYKAAVERVQRCPLLDDPQLPSGALIDQAKHLGNLAFNIWNNMKDLVSYTPVILDPNTANPELMLGEDLSSVRRGKRRQLPENPERFEYWDSVLGSGFDSGTHSWDVEVGNNKDWELGVVVESGCRQSFVGSTVWSVEFNGLGYRAFSPKDRYTSLSIRDKLRRVRVQLDWDGGTLTFSDPDTDTLVHTFSHTFTERLCPHLCTRSPLPLRVLPAPVSVVTGSN